MIDYGIKNNRGYGYILVVMDNFSKYGNNFPLKSEAAQTITNEFIKIIHKSTRKPSLIGIKN